MYQPTSRPLYWDAVCDCAADRAGSVPSSQRFKMFCSKAPMSPSGKIRSRSSLRSRNLFLGSIPETAWRIICQTRLGFAGEVEGPHATHLVRLPPHHVLVLNLLQTSGVHRMVPVDELLSLLPSDLDVPRVCHDDVVPTVGWTTRESAAISSN